MFKISRIPARPTKPELVLVIVGVTRQKYLFMHLFKASIVTVL